jgi:GTP diphosphokinase / guanosine-3',5'-bis(diphosphate) 3'-diphosphatase
VHRDDRTNSQEPKMPTDRLVEASGKPTAGSMFLVAIQVEALDGRTLLADITRALLEEGADILSATVTTTRDRTVVSRFRFEMADLKHLGHLLNAVRNVESVMDCHLVTTDAAPPPAPGPV